MLVLLTKLTRKITKPSWALMETSALGGDVLDTAAIQTFLVQPVNTTIAR
jgi:hypothetical protein